MYPHFAFRAQNFNRVLIFADYFYEAKYLVKYTIFFSGMTTIMNAEADYFWASSLFILGLFYRSRYRMGKFFWDDKISNIF